MTRVVTGNGFDGVSKDPFGNEDRRFLWRCLSWKDTALDSKVLQIERATTSYDLLGDYPSPT